jgi:hypothetical protein
VTGTQRLEATTYNSANPTLLYEFCYFILYGVGQQQQLLLPLVYNFLLLLFFEYKIFRLIMSLL